MRRLAPLAITGALLMAACGGGDPEVLVDETTPAEPLGGLVVAGPGRYPAEMESGGVLRRFVVHVPEGARDPAPLVVVFHGFTASPAEAERLTAMHEVGSREGFVTAYPAARGLLPAWRSDRGVADDTDVVFFRELVEVIAAAVPLDRSRVYVAGMSNGGGMVDRLACEAADLVAAAAPVAGAYSSGACEPVEPVPVAAFHGTADWIVPFGGFGRLLPPVAAWAEEWAERNGCGAPAPPRAVVPDVTLYSWQGCAYDVALFVVDEGGHGWPGSEQAAARGNSTMSVSASETIWEFFADHPKR